MTHGAKRNGTHLTKIQLTEMLEAFLSGLTNKGVADLLGVNISTVKYWKPLLLRDTKPLRQRFSNGSRDIHAAKLCYASGCTLPPEHGAKFCSKHGYRKPAHAAKLMAGR